MSIFGRAVADAGAFTALADRLRLENGRPPLRRLIVACDIWKALCARIAERSTESVNGHPFESIGLGGVPVVKDPFFPDGRYFEDRGQFDGVALVQWPAVVPVRCAP